MTEPLITIRVPRELRERMRRTGINWSEELRRAINSKLEAERRADAAKELERILSTIAPGFSTLRAIKEDRKHG